MPSPPPLGGSTVATAVATGLAAGAATDLLLVVGGAGSLAGLQLGVVAAPLLLLAALAPVRRALIANPAAVLVVIGAAWTLAPFVDQHLTRAVVLHGALPDLIHHLAGWPALIIGARLLQRQPSAETISSPAKQAPTT
jgi:hypothetical protein